ncbi:MAG: GAF domain-containing sensor histidine kinase [Deltaproteobacteria bacterium]|nr:GAF domain-containing sensor histidine kinase [Deltaproteobacteria bacterium]
MTVFHCSFRNITGRRKAERPLLDSKIRAQLEKIGALREIALAVNSTMDLQDVLKVLLEKVDPFLPCPAITAVSLLNKETGLIERVACRNIKEEEWMEEIRGIGSRKGDIVWFIIRTKSPAAISNMQTDPRIQNHQLLHKYGLASYLGVPLIAKDEPLGVLSIYTKEKYEFSEEEIEFLWALAEETSSAVSNSQLYEQTKKQALELERANKVKSDFLSVMSHELRTPLTAIVGYTGLVRDGVFGEINPEQEKALAKVMIRSNELLHMINGVLQVTSIEANDIDVDIRQVELDDFLNALRSDYDVPLDKELRLVWDYPSGLPAVKTDSEKLKHILRNIINNAIKFTQKGRVIVSARMKEGYVQEGRGSGHLEVSVSDTGMGIPNEKIPIIFDMFSQVDSSETRPYGGVGLGLYIVKKYTELLRGTVQVESEVGKGSTFTVKIPCENIKDGYPGGASLRLDRPTTRTTNFRL